MDKIDIKYDEIANYLNKSNQTIRGWKIKAPELLAFAKNGSLLKKYNLDNLEDVKSLIQLHYLLKDNNISFNQLETIVKALNIKK